MSVRVLLPWGHASPTVPSTTSGLFAYIWCLPALYFSKPHNDGGGKKVRRGMSKPGDRFFFWTQSYLLCHSIHHNASQMTTNLAKVRCLKYFVLSWHVVHATHMENIKLFFPLSIWLNDWNEGQLDTSCDKMAAGAISENTGGCGGKGLGALRKMTWWRCSGHELWSSIVFKSKLCHVNSCVSLAKWLNLSVFLLHL
jgi:hypothetical protein